MAVASRAAAMPGAMALMLTSPAMAVPRNTTMIPSYPVTLPELEDRLRTEKALNPDFPVVVRGDATVQYQKVIEVLDLLRRLELSQVGLVTGKPT